MSFILKKAKNYIRKPYKAPMIQRHLYDPYTPEPVILKPNPDSKKKEKKPDDITGNISHYIFLIIIKIFLGNCQFQCLKLFHMPKDIILQLLFLLFKGIILTTATYKKEKCIYGVHVV